MLEDALPADTEPTRPAFARLARAVRAVAYSLLPLAILLLVLEVVLRLAGLGDPDARLGIARGFDRSARYLVPDADVPGAWRTQMFDGDSREVFIPPRDGRVRVLLFGGSNTIAFPERLLAELLGRARPQPGWELVNLGRPGYGSERVSILLEQAMVLEPDIVLIYSGHNEFVERGFAMELAEAWGPPGAEDLARAMQRLRTVNVLTDLLAARSTPAGEASAAPHTRPGDDAEPGADAEGRPETHAAARETFFNLSYEQTLLFYDVYRDNLTAMCRTARQHGAQVMLCTVVGNMLSQPAVAANPRNVLLEDKLRRHTYLVDRALRRLPGRTVDGLMPLPGGRPPIRPHWYDWGQQIPGTEGTAGPRDSDRPPPPRLRQLKPPFAGGPFWADPSGWSDEVHALVRTLAQFHARKLTADERHALEEARALLEEALTLMPQDSLSTYALGLCQYLAGDDARAVQLFREAARLDLAPNRGNDITNDIVRRLGASLPDVLVVDVEAIVAGACPSGLIGYELMVDSCHLHAATLPLLMESLVPGLLALAERGVGSR
jgi:hypothetical protein